MASEITINGSLAVTNGISVESYNPGQLRANQATVGAHGPTVAVPAADTVISFGSLVTPRWIMFRNLDPSNYVQIGPESGGAMVPMIRLQAGEVSQPIPLEPGIVLRWKSHTAICKVKMLALET
jgi:hypothetical protein